MCIRVCRRLLIVVFEDGYQVSFVIGSLTLSEGLRLLGTFLHLLEETYMTMPADAQAGHTIRN